MYRRPLGLWTAPFEPSAWKDDQLASGVALLPERVRKDTPVPAAVSDCQTVCASSAVRTRETKVPELGAAPLDSQSSLTLVPPTSRSLTTGPIASVIAA